MLTNDKELADVLKFHGTARTQHQSHSLADTLRDWIARSALAEGSRLTSEQELVRLTGSSRATVREALRLLADQGLIRTRPGPGGGVFIARPGPDRLVKSLGIVLEAGQVEAGQLLEARIELESAAARLGALRITPEEIAAMRESCHRLELLGNDGNVDAAIRENLNFHSLIVSSSHNEVFILLHGAIRELIWLSTREMITDTGAVRDQIRGHERITDALEQRDAEAAARRVRRHMEALAEYLKSVDKLHLLSRRVRF